LSACTAVAPVSISPLACSNDRVEGLGTTLEAGTTTSPAYAPWIGKATTSELGLKDVRAYLVDRLVTQPWTLAEVAGELGATPATLRRLLDRYQVGRVAPTQRQRAAAAAVSGPQKQARAVRQGRQARLVELGFDGLEDYLPDRYVGGASRCGGCALSLESAIRGWPRNSISSGSAPELQIGWGLRLG